MENASNALSELSLEDIFGTNDIVVNNEEPLWDKLIQQIIEGNVIPVIGADMLMDSKINLHDFVISKIAKTYHVASQPKSFSELVYDPDYKKQFEKDQIYYQVNDLFRNFQNVCSAGARNPSEA